MTVLKALALAEDTKSTAQKSKAVIIRKNPQEKNERQEIAVNLKNVLTGRAPDPRMQASDILFVPDSSGTKALRRDRKSTRLNSSHSQISYAVFCLKKKKKKTNTRTSAITNTLRPYYLV